ncbi:GTP-binding protein 8-like [Asterias amurensis]|uniref:GTP-binding protein 8-like n=1 Tax=Asterias amurensis TaxID=7602 RepID=UPI003AB6A41A
MFQMMTQQRAVFFSWIRTYKTHRAQTVFKSTTASSCQRILRNNTVVSSSRRTFHPPTSLSSSTVTSPLSYPLQSHHYGNKQCFFRQPSRLKSTNQSSPPALNPLLQMQSYVQLPILSDNELIFTPTEADLAKACQLFVPSPDHQIKFLKGAYYHEQAPDYQLPEIAFIGRSNVGKSSLIKAMFSQVPGLDVRTSKTPGHTKLLLFFQVGSGFSLVDMPGYGFNQPQNFIISAEGFLKGRKNLRNTFLLIDSSVGLKPLDYVALEMLEEFSIPYLIVLTKSDKASKRQLVESIMTVSKVIRENTQCCLPQPFLVSSKSKAGLSFLMSFIAYTTDNLKLQET